MTPLIFEIVEEVTTNTERQLFDLDAFVEWIEQMRHEMRHDHELRFELRQFSVYSKNPAYYWPHIQKSY